MTERTRSAFRLATLVWAGLLALTSVCPAQYTDPVLVWLIGGGALIVGAVLGAFGVVAWAVWHMNVKTRG